MSEAIVICAVLVAALFVTHLFVIRSLFLSQQEAMNDWQDALSKIAQIGFIHAKAKTPEQAASVQLALESEQKKLDAPPEKQDPPRKVIGMKLNGRVVIFGKDATRPDEATLARIPEDKKVYQ